MPPSFHHLESLSTKSFFARIKKNGGVSFSSVPFSPRLKSDNRIFYLRKTFFFLSLVFDQKKLKELLAESWETKWKGPFCGQRLKDLTRRKKILLAIFFSCPCLLMRSWRRFNICFGDGRVNIWRQQRSNSFHRERASFCLTINPIIRFFSLLTPKQRSYICDR